MHLDSEWAYKATEKYSFVESYFDLQKYPIQ